MEECKRYVVRPVGGKYLVFDTKTKLALAAFQFERHAVDQVAQLNELVEAHVRASSQATYQQYPYKRGLLFKH
jgi:hypothetical protein